MKFDNNMKQLLSLILAMVLYFECITLLAANSGEVIREFEFSVLILDPTTGTPGRSSPRYDPIHYEYEGRTVWIHTSLGASSEYYRYSGPVPVVFYREETHVNDEGIAEIIRVPLAAIRNIPPRAERLLFILVPLPDGRYANHVVDYSRRILPPGHVMVANLSGAEVAFTVSDDSPKIIVAGETAVARRDEVGRYRFFMRLASRNGDNSWTLIDSGFHLAAQDSRQLFLLHRYNYQRRWNVQRIHALDAIVPIQDDEMDDLTDLDEARGRDNAKADSLSPEDRQLLERLDTAPQFF
jgi:hypothetical protein